MIAGRKQRRELQDAIVFWGIMLLWGPAEWFLLGRPHPWWAWIFLPGLPLACLALGALIVAVRWIWDGFWGIA